MVQSQCNRWAVHLCRLQQRNDCIAGHRKSTGSAQHQLWQRHHLSGLDEQHQRSGRRRNRIRRKSAGKRNATYIRPNRHANAHCHFSRIITKHSCHNCRASIRCRWHRDAWTTSLPNRIRRKCLICCWSAWQMDACICRCLAFCRAALSMWPNALAWQRIVFVLSTQSWALIFGKFSFSLRWTRCCDCCGSKMMCIRCMRCRCWNWPPNMDTFWIRWREFRVIWGKANGIGGWHSVIYVQVHWWDYPVYHWGMGNGIVGNGQ